MRAWVRGWQHELWWRWTFSQRRHDFWEWIEWGRPTWWRYLIRWPRAFPEYVWIRVEYRWRRFRRGW